MRLLHFLFGLIAYLMFNGVFVYFAGFLVNIGVPKGIDTPLSDFSLWQAALVDGLWLALFALHHSIAPRMFFKRLLLRWLPAHLERSVYVLVSSLLLALVMAAWQPIPGEVWRFDGGAPRMALLALFAVGTVLPLLASFQIDHYDLFGMRQVRCYWLQRPYVSPTFGEKGLYRVVRHPIMLGTMIVLWATPLMTWGHLLWAAFLTAYIFIGIHFEERDLCATLGSPYIDYQKRIPMIIPLLRPPR